MNSTRAQDRDLQPAPDFRPVRLVDIELTEPIEDLAFDGPARLLIRQAGRPVAWLTVVVPPDGLPADALRMLIGHEVPNLQDDSGPPAYAPCGGAANGTARPKISVVVTTCEASTGLLCTLDGLREQTLSPAEVLVVDNRPATSGVRKLLASSFAPGVHIVEEWQPGLSRARNAGLRLASSDIVAFSDDDVMIDPGWLAALSDGFVDDDVACVTGLVLPMELRTQAQCWFEEFGGFSKGFRWRRFDLDANRGHGLLYPFAPGVFGTGANAAFRTSMLRQLGGFDEDLGAGTPARGGEDLDIFLTVVQNGFGLVYNPAALVRHRHHPDLPDLRKQLYDYGVGLSAVIAKRWVTQPRERTELLRRSTAGLRHLLSPGSAKNAYRSPSYPRALELAELRGVLYGPVAYFRSRRTGRG